MCGVGPPQVKQTLIGLLLQTSQWCAPIFLVALPNLIDILALGQLSRHVAKWNIFPKHQVDAWWGQAYLGKERALRERGLGDLTGKAYKMP